MAEYKEPFIGRPFPVCPHCEITQHAAACGEAAYEDEDILDLVCSNCQKAYRVRVERVVQYSTLDPEQEEGGDG